MYCAGVRVNKLQLMLDACLGSDLVAQDLNHEYKLFHGKTMLPQCELSKHDVEERGNLRWGKTDIFFPFLCFCRVLIVSYKVTNANCRVTFIELGIT